MQGASINNHHEAFFVLKYLRRLCHHASAGQITASSQEKGDEDILDFREMGQQTKHIPYANHAVTK